MNGLASSGTSVRLFATVLATSERFAGKGKLSGGGGHELEDSRGWINRDRDVAIALFSKGKVSPLWASSVSVNRHKLRIEDMAREKKVYFGCAELEVR